MKVNAFRCDCCKGIFIDEHITGFNGQHDMFDISNSFPLTKYPDTATYHFCDECYRQKVLVAADNGRTNRKDEDAYKANCRELLYLLKRRIFNELSGAIKKV